MKVKIIFFEDNYYLSIDSKETKQLSENSMRNFLKNYDTFCDSLEFSRIPFETSDISNGCVVAYVENKKLCILNSELLKNVFFNDISSYLTCEEYANKHNRKRSIVIRLCGQGRLKGAVQKGTAWLIPEDSPYPADARVGARVKVIEQRIKRK